MGELVGDGYGRYGLGLRNFPIGADKGQRPVVESDRIAVVGRYFDFAADGDRDLRQTGRLADVDGRFEQNRVERGQRAFTAVQALGRNAIEGYCGQRLPKSKLQRLFARVDQKVQDATAVGAGDQLQRFGIARVDPEGQVRLHSLVYPRKQGFGVVLILDAQDQSTALLEGRQPVIQRLLHDATGRADDDTGCDILDVDRTVCHAAGFEDVGIDDVEIQLVFQQQGPDPAVGRYILPCRQDRGVVDEQDLGIDISALEMAIKRGDALREVVPQRPVGHLKEKGGRGVVLFQCVGRIEETVRHQIADAHENQHFGDEFGVLHSAAPTEAVVTLVERALFVVKIGCRCRSLGAAADIAGKYIQFRGARLGVARIASGNVHVFELRQAHPVFLARISDTVPDAPVRHRPVVGVEEHLIQQLV